MTKEELFKMMNEHPVMYVATNENGQPHVRAILMFKADADGIVFHTGVTKDLYRQLLADPRFVGRSTRLPEILDEGDSWQDRLQYPSSSERRT